MIHRKRLTRQGAQDARGRVRYVETAPWPGAQVLRPAQHGGLTWRAPVDLHFADAVEALPLSLSEVMLAAAHLPLVLSDGAVPRPMVLLRARGAQQGLIVKGRIASRYLPQILRFYPFCPLPQPQVGQLVLAGDLDGGYLGYAQDGQAVFDSAGQLSPPVAQLVQHLTQWQAGRDAALIAAKALARADLLRPAHSAAPGWRMVDPQKLADLDAATVAILHQTGALALAHAVIISTGHMARLLDHGSATATGLPDGPTAPMPLAGQDFIAAMARAQEDTSQTLFDALASQPPAVTESTGR